MGHGLAQFILLLARADGFENSLVYGKRAPWFKEKIPLFFVPAAYLQDFAKVVFHSFILFLNKRKSAAKRLYSTKEHQDDSSGNRSEESKPIFAHIFLSISIMMLLVKALKQYKNSKTKI